MPVTKSKVRTNLLIILFCSFVCLHIIISTIKIVKTFAPDFSVFYQAASALVRGVNPYEVSTLYTGFGYPIITALVFIPFTLLPYRLAQGVFVFSSFISVFLIVWLSLKLTAKKFSLAQFLLFLAFAFLSFPTKFTLGMGQSNLIAYLLLLTGYFFYRKDKQIASGLSLGIAFIIKPLLSFLIFFFLFKRRWQLLKAILFVVLILIAISVFLFGFNFYIYYFNQVIPPLLSFSGREIYYNQGLSGFVARLVANTTLRLISTLVISLIFVGGLVYRLFREKNENIQFALFLTTLTLIDTLSWQHHFVFLIFPFIVLALQVIKRKRGFLLLLLSYFLISSNIKNPLVFSNFPLNLLLSHVFFGTVILLFLLSQKTKQ